MPTGDSLTAILRPFVLAAFSLLPAAGPAADGMVAAAAGVASFIFFTTLFLENSKLKESKTCIIFFNYFKINVIVQSYD